MFSENNDMDGKLDGMKFILTFLDIKYYVGVIIFLAFIAAEVVDKTRQSNHQS